MLLGIDNMSKKRQRIRMKRKMALSAFMGLIISSSILTGTEISDYINDEKCDKIIDKKVFTVCYDYIAKGAKYVYYTLDGKLVNAVNLKKRKSFYTEKNLPKAYRSYNKDYTHSGYDRGHLASDASFDYDKKVLRKVYTMANIIPQSPKVNRYTWIKSEKLERLVAVKLGSVHILNGVIYDENPQRIGKHNIAIPKAFWKMIFNDDANYKKCFLYQNSRDIDTKKDKLKNHEIECSLLD